MVFTKKFSEFAQGNVGDPVGLTNGVNTIGQGGDDSSGGVIITIDQDTTGLFASRWVRFDNATQLYVDALATTSQNAEVVGVVLEVLSGSQFKLQQSGYIQSGTAGFSGFSTDGVYFLSDVAQGQQTLNVPTENGHIRLPLFVADSTDSGWICNLKSGMVIGSPGAITGGGSTPGEDSSIHQVSQPGNGFGVGDWVRVSGNSVYSLASGATFADSQGVGVVIDDGDPLFTIQFSGFNENSIIGAVDAAGSPIPLTSSTVYYLSDVAPGKITPVKPTATLTSVKPCFISESSTMLTGYILPQQPIENEPGEEAPSVILVNQSTTGLAVENVMRVSGDNVYAKAQADSLANSRAVGIITEIIDANNFVLQTSGFSNKFTAKTPATQYYLSATVPGLLTSTEPTADGQISKPMFEALTATSGYILEQRPLLQPNANGGGSSGGGGGSIAGNVVQTLFNPPSDVSIAANTSIIQSAVTITPSSSTSRIMYCASLQVVNGDVTVWLLRNGVKIASGSSFLGFIVTYAGAGVTTGSFTVIDSPSTTLPVTYTLMMSGNRSLYGNPTGIGNIFIAQEIGPAP